MSGGVFISYRRDDAKHVAGRLVDRLGRTLPSGKIFLDVDNIAPGLDFKKTLAERVQSCDVLLALIGPSWIASVDDHGRRRLDDPRDFVRLEIEAALARDIRVIPVLVDDARLPREEDLPPSLRPLLDRQSVRLTHERFVSEADLLAKSLAGPVGGETSSDAGRVGEAAVPSRAASGVSIEKSSTKPASAARGSAATAEAQTSKWAAKVISRRPLNVIIGLVRDGRQHIVELDLKRWRLRDVFIVDGVEERFFIGGLSAQREFKLGPHPETLVFAAQFTVMGSIAGFEITEGGQTIISGT